MGATLGPLVMTALLGVGVSWRWGYGAPGPAPGRPGGGLRAHRRGLAPGRPGGRRRRRPGDGEAGSSRSRGPGGAHGRRAGRGASTRRGGRAIRVAPGDGRRQRRAAVAGPAGLPGLRRDRGGHRFVGLRAAHRPGTGHRRGRSQRDRSTGARWPPVGWGRRRRAPGLASAGAGRLGGRRGGRRRSGSWVLPTLGATVALVVLGPQPGRHVPGAHGADPGASRTRRAPTRVISNQLAASVWWAARPGRPPWGWWPSTSGRRPSPRPCWPRACVFLAVTDVVLTAVGRPDG